MEKVIYLDHAATTPTRKEVADAMYPYFTDKFGNPSSIYGIAAQNKNIINQVRETIAKTLNAKSEEIYFTAGGTE